MDVYWDSIVCMYVYCFTGQIVTIACRAHAHGGEELLSGPIC